MRSLIRAAAVIAAAVAFYVVVVLPYRGNLVLRAVAERSELARATSPDRAAVAARDNLVALERVAGSRRLDPTWYMLYAANCELLDRGPQAVDAYTRALRIDDRPELYVNRAMIRLRLGQTDAAVADLTLAARFNPGVLDEIDGDLRARVAAAAGLP